jgi:hypothetical protein
LPPDGLTRPTPGTSAIFEASRLLAMSCSWVSDIALDVTASVRIG